jgi:hypothetical protein
MDGELQCLAKAGLHLDEPLVVKFNRCETKRFVCRDYEVDEERQADVFNMIVRVRDLHQVMVVVGNGSSRVIFVYTPFSPRGCGGVGWCREWWIYCRL